MRLSIITSGKNDDYAGNFLQRLQFNLDKLNDNIKKLNVSDIEIIVVDWGSEVRLSSVLNTENFEFTKFLYVPLELCQKYSPESSFSLVHSLNSGFIRSKGDYIFFIDGDSYIPFESFKKTYEVTFINNNYLFYWASRYHLPYDIHSSVKTFNFIDDNLLNFKNYKHVWRHDKININNFEGTAMGLLLNRDLCYESTLFYEELTKWGWMDIEIHRRISRKYTCQGDLEDFGIYFFHLDHHNIKSCGLNGVNSTISASSFNANNDNWGLNKEILFL